MKNLLLVSMIIPLMFSFAAVSQEKQENVLTRQEVIQLEGMDEAIETTYFQSHRGYSMWIDTDYLAAQPEGEGNDMDVFLRPGDEERKYEVIINYWGGLEYSFDLAIQTSRENLSMNYGNADDIGTEGVFSGFEARGFYAADNGGAILQYVVDAGDGAYFIMISFPREAAEGYGSRVVQMLKSFEIHE